MRDLKVEPMLASPTLLNVSFPITPTTALKFTQDLCIELEMVTYGPATCILPSGDRPLLFHVLYTVRKMRTQIEIGVSVLSVSEELTFSSNNSC